MDSGQVVNPDGLRNQIEGGIIQSASWTLHEKVASTATRIRSFDWSTYPILRFDGVPESIDVHIVDRPGDPYLGSGEAAQGPGAALSAMPWRMRRGGGCATCRWISAAPRRWRRSIGPECDPRRVDSRGPNWQ